MGIFDKFRREKGQPTMAEGLRGGAVFGETSPSSSIRERVGSRIARGSTVAGERWGEHMERRRAERVERKRLYEEAKGEAQKQKIQHEERSRAYHDVYGGRPLGTSLSIYGHAAAKTYHKARSTSLIDALISGSAGHGGRFEARRRASPAAFYANKENIFGPTRRYGRRLRRRPYGPYGYGYAVPKGRRAFPRRRRAPLSYTSWRP